jgi:hypothetical protein
MTKINHTEIDLCDLRQQILEKFERINAAAPEKLNPLIKEMLREADVSTPVEESSVSSAYNIDFVLLS